jgi:hypothetical protein
LYTRPVLNSPRLWIAASAACAAALFLAAALPAFQEDPPPQETPAVPEATSKDDPAKTLPPVPKDAAAKEPATPLQEDLPLPPPGQHQTNANLPLKSPRMEADPGAALLDSGFRHLYELHFADGRNEFVQYQKLHPEDPLGKAAEAASYLFEQFNSKGVLTSEFFLNDSKFLNGVDGNPKDNRNNDFEVANQQARTMAKQRLSQYPRDPHSLLVLTMTDGMEADYDALIEKKQMASLGLIKQAEAEAKDVLGIDPSAQDAYVALGAGNYIVGCLPGYKRAIIWFGGVHGDRQRGMDQLQSAATNGHYLQPFAKILLALASERERHHDRARSLLAELATEFPANPLFQHELELLGSNAAGKR